MIQIATWNVNSVRARLPLLLMWLEEKNPDVVLLQETKVEDALFPREILEDRGYNIVFFGQKTYNGVAILSKSPLEDMKFGLALAEDIGARYVEAFTAGYRVASVYVPNGQEPGSEKYFQKQKFFEALAERTRELLAYREPLVLGGDYNVAPQDSDVYDPEAWREKILCSTLERAWFRSVIHLGLTDAVAAATLAKMPDAALGGAKNPYTWWDYRGQAFARNAGLRIDHLLLSSEAADRLQETFIEVSLRDQEKASDHAPVIGVFRT